MTHIDDKAQRVYRQNFDTESAVDITKTRPPQSETPGLGANHEYIKK